MTTAARGPATERAYISKPESGPADIGGDVFVVEGDTRARLAPRNDLRNHSPTGFAWHYHGSGPAQLALAILCDATGHDDRAIANYMPFKDEIIAHLPAGEWNLTMAEVIEWLRARTAKTVRARSQLAVDYCPHCCVNHVIGEHPHEDETEAAYWRRMESRQ